MRFEACGVYQILNIVNNKRYIGSSINLYKRGWQHQKEFAENRHGNRFLQRAYNKYGEDSFKIETLIECSSEDLEFYEDLIIKGYRSNEKEFGYNLRIVSKSNRGMSFPKRLVYKAGDTYNRLTLLEETRVVGDRRYWLCQCSCGNIKEISASDVRHGHTKSCGCLNKEKCIERIVRHVKKNGAWNKKSGGQSVLASMLGAQS